MKSSPSSNSKNSDPVDQRFVVSSDATLREFLDEFADSSLHYALTENEEHQIVGIVDLNRARLLLSVENTIERARWENLAVGSLAETLAPGPDAIEIEPSETTLSGDLREGSYSLLRDRTGLAAIVVDGQIFVNWNRAHGSISLNHLDPVTALPVRLAFNRRICEEVERASRSDQSLAVFLIDLDHFKDVNDRFGHRTGDSVLRSVAAGLREGIRSYDFAARFGGDEFGLICAGCTPNNIHLPVKRLRDAHSRRLSASGPLSGLVTLSIGAAVLRRVDAACSPEVIVEQADLCLYRAKRAGRNTAFVVELDPFGLPVSPSRELERSEMDPAKAPAK